MFTEQEILDSKNINESGDFPSVVRVQRHGAKPKTKKTAKWSIAMKRIEKKNKKTCLSEKRNGRGPIFML